MLVDITKFARHLCPSGSRFVTEQTVHCSITVVKQTVHVLTAVWEGLCVSVVITITQSTMYNYCVCIQSYFAADMKPINSILGTYVRKLLSLYTCISCRVSVVPVSDFHKQACTEDHVM